MPTEMTMRDHFAAAALTGLLVHANDDIDEETLDTPSDIAYTAYQMADAMLREWERTNHDAAPAARASLPTADHAVCRGRDSGGGTGVTPAIDRLREWERHGSRRWGLGAAGDVTMLERRLAMVEAIVHDAAPAARSGDAGAGEQTAEPCVETDWLTPDSRTGPINRKPECESPRRECGESLRRDVTHPDTKGRAAGGPAHNTTEPVAWGVEDDRGLQYALHPTPGHANHMARTASVGLGHVVPLYRHQPVAESEITATLTDEERQAIWTVAEAYAENDGDHECEKIARVMQQLWQRTK